MTVVLGSAILLVLAGWATRPRLMVRDACRRRSRSRRWVLVLPAAAAAIASPILAVGAAAAVMVTRRLTRLRRAQRRRREMVADYPEALDLIVLSIRAGYLPAEAIIEIVPHLPASLRPAFITVGDSMRHGTRFADALGELGSRLGPVTQPLVDSLSSADRYGLPLAPVLERLAFDARQQRRRDAEAAARELPVRLAAPLVVCTLPSFVLLGIVPLLLGALSSLHT